MTEVDKAVIVPIERALAALPFGGSPLGRAAITAAMGGAIAYYVRPSVSFDENGQPRPWILIDQQNPNATIFPWQAWVVVPGILFGIFI